MGNEAVEFYLCEEIVPFYSHARIGKATDTSEWIPREELLNHIAHLFGRVRMCGSGCFWLGLASDSHSNHIEWKCVGMQTLYACTMARN